MFYWTNNYSQLRNTSELLHIQMWWMEFSFIFLGFSWFPGTVLHPGIQWWIRPLTHNSHTTVHEITRKMVLAVYLWCFGSVWKNVSNICLITNIGEGGGTPLQYSCLENPMDGGAWWAAVHGVAKSRTRLSDFTSTFHFHALEKEMATHSSVLAWRIPGTGKPCGLPSMGLHRGTRLKRLSSSSHLKWYKTLMCFM